MKNTGLDAVEIAQKQRHLYLLGKVKNNRHLSSKELEELKKLEEKNRETKDERRATVKKAKAAAVADAEIIKTQKEAAAYASVSVRTVRRWVKAGMPRTEAGHYIKSMLHFYRDNEGNQPTEAKAKGQAADAEYKDAKARLMQIDLEVKQGRLIPADQIEAGRVARILAVKRALLGLGRKLAPQLAKIKDERKIQRIINDQVKAMIKGFAE